MITINGRILVSGNLVQDTVVQPVEEIRFGGTVWVDAIEHHMGGNGASTSYAIGILGGQVALVGAVGTDQAGEALITRLAAAGVDTSGINRSAAGTAASVVIVRPDGARAFLHRPGVSRDALAGEIPFARYAGEGFRHYHLANPFALIRVRERAAEFLHAARAARLTTSMDTAWDSKGQWIKVVGPCLPQLDLLFANEDEARELTGCADPLDAARAFVKAGAGAVVLKLGARGALMLDGATKEDSPALPVRAVDTTGAGDCFTGAFLVALQRGLDPHDAIRVANAVGALSVSALGATTGLKNWDETLAFLRSQN